MVDVNLIPKKEAVAYLKSSVPGDHKEAELTDTLIELLDLGLLEAGYHDGHVAYRVKGDPYKALATLLSLYSEEEIMPMLREWKKITEEYKEIVYPPIEEGMVLGPLMELLEYVQGIPPGEVMFIQGYVLESCYDSKDFNQGLATKLGEYFSTLSWDEDRASEAELREMLREIRYLVMEEERKAVKTQGGVYKFIELYEEVSNRFNFDV